MAKTSAVVSDIVYADIPTNLDIHPIKKDLMRVTNEKAVTNSVRNLLLTNFYERRMNPRVGSNLRALQFENITQTTQIQIETAIRECITANEPRAILLSVTVAPHPDQNLYYASVLFTLTNAAVPVSLTVALSKVR